MIARCTQMLNPKKVKPLHHWKEEDAVEASVGVSDSSNTRSLILGSGGGEGEDKGDALKDSYNGRMKRRWRVEFLSLIHI